MSSTHDSGGTVDGTLGQSAKGDHYFALPAGTELLEYQIEALLGHGGFGITYRAIDRVLRQSVAVKEYFPNDIAVRMSEKTVTAKSIGDAPEFKIGLDSFLEEARVISRFRHPNIVRVRRFFELHGTAYIALDYEQGRTLSQRLAAGAVPEPELLQILRGIIDGLETVHEQAVLHRDLKPSNVILRDDNTPVLIDFGAARDFRERHSRSITAIAAPGYSPPEQYGVGGQQGPWTDIYALGAIAYKCVTGNTPPESLRRLRNDPIIPASKAAAGKYNPELLGTIDWMLSIEEANRPGSVQFVRDRLEPSPTGAAKRTPARRGARLQPPSQRWLPLAAVLVAVFAIGAFTATTNFGWIRGMFAPAAKPAAAAVETTRETPRVASAAPSPPAPRVAPDDAAWKEIKDGSDIGQLRHFLEQFPNSTHHDAATQKLAALTPPPPPPVPRAAPPELPPPPPAPAADEIAWDFLKDSRDAALLRQFVERFPTSSRRAAAEARLAMLEQ